MTVAKLRAFARGSTRPSWGDAWIGINQVAVAVTSRGFHAQGHSERTGGLCLVCPCEIKPRETMYVGPDGSRIHAQVSCMIGLLNHLKVEPPTPPWNKGGGTRTIMPTFVPAHGS